MDERPIRFTSLDPTRDSEAFERTVARIGARARPLLARRRRSQAPLVEIDMMRRPLLAAAAAIMLVASAALALNGRTTDTSEATTVSFTSDLLLAEDSLLSLDDLLEQRHEDTR